MRCEFVRSQRMDASCFNIIVNKNMLTTLRHSQEDCMNVDSTLPQASPYQPVNKPCRAKAQLSDSCHSLGILTTFVYPLCMFLQ